MRETVHLFLEKQLYHRERLSGIVHTMWLGMKARTLFKEMKSKAESQKMKRKVKFEEKKGNDETKGMVGIG